MLRQCRDYVGSEENERFVILVDSTCNMSITSKEGFDTFLILASPHSTITITDFSLDNDVIDLRNFETIRSWKDVKMTAGSVLIHLPDNMTVVLLHHSPTDMTPKHFLFRSSGTTYMSKALRVAYIVLSVISLAMLFEFFIKLAVGYHRSKNTSSVASIDDEEQEVDDIESGGQHWTSNETPQVANHSIHPIPEESEEDDMQESSYEDASSESLIDPISYLGEISSESSFAGFSDGNESHPEDIESQDPIMRKLFSLSDEELRRGTAVMRLAREVQELYGDEDEDEE